MQTIDDDVPVIERTDVYDVALAEAAEAAERKRGSIPWHKQELQGGVAPSQVLRLMRQSMRAGVPWTEWDHNHSAYQPGYSNKQIKIVGSILLGRPSELTYEDALGACLDVIVGGW